MLARIPEGACACGAEGHMASIGPPALGAKGCVRSAQGGRRMAVRTAMDHPIGALPRTPFPASRDFPSRGNKKFEEKNREAYTSCTTPAFPLWWLAPPPSPHFVVGLWMLSHGAMSLQESIETYSAPLAGEVRRSRIGGASAASQSAECLSCHMTKKANPVTLTL